MSTVDIIETPQLNPIPHTDETASRGGLANVVVW
jgi:hypothetical protein